MSKAFLVYGHYNDKSFNAAIKDTFIETAKNLGHTVDYVDLYKGESPPPVSKEYQEASWLEWEDRSKKKEKPHVTWDEE